MTESEFDTVLSAMAHEIETLKYERDFYKEEAAKLRDNMRINIHIEKEATE